MLAIRSGFFSGGYTVFPKFGVGVDLRNGGVVLADVHEAHGNTPLLGAPDSFERITLVCYFRENLVECGTAEEELERVKNRNVGDRLSERGAAWLKHRKGIKPRKDRL